MVKHPDETRRKLLETAFRTFYEHGYQGSGIDAILARAGVTKGALYHHFANKKELGLAVIDEVIRAWMNDRWVQPLTREGNPVDQIRKVVHDALNRAGDDGVRLGCPLNNIAQEMAPIDEDFRVRIEALFTDWRDGVAGALRRGQAAGQVRAELDAEATAVFLVSTFEGGIGTAKSAQSMALARTFVRALEAYLDSLRAPRASAGRKPSRRGTRATARRKETLR